MHNVIFYMHGDVGVSSTFAVPLVRRRMVQHDSPALGDASQRAVLWRGSALQAIGMLIIAPHAKRCIIALDTDRKSQLVAYQCGDGA